MPEASLVVYPLKNKYSGLALLVTCIFSIMEKIFKMNVHFVWGTGFKLA